MQYLRQRLVGPLWHEWLHHGGLAGLCVEFRRFLLCHFLLLQLFLEVHALALADMLAWEIEGLGHRAWLCRHGPHIGRIRRDAMCLELTRHCLGLDSLFIKPFALDHRVFLGDLERLGFRVLVLMDRLETGTTDDRVGVEVHADDFFLHGLGFERRLT